MSKAKLRAEAINRFVTDAKAQGVYSALKAACILTGWDTLAGALTPLVGSAPTNNGFVAADLDRGGQGLKGDGSSKYLNSNRANNADGQNDQHASVYVSSQATLTSSLLGSRIGGDETGSTQLLFVSGFGYSSRVHNVAPSGPSLSPVGFYGAKRSAAASFDVRIGAGNYNYVAESQTPNPESIHVFRRSGTTSNIPADARLSWYSIGSSVDLSALDTLVTRLMADLRAIEEDGMDRDALAYIRAVEAADGSFMTTGVKQAVDRLVKGLKYDRDANGRSAWDAIGASCLLCGPRTIAGALVPLRGAAPTAYNFVSANYNQETGLVGVPASLTYILTGLPYNAISSGDEHLSVYMSSPPGADQNLIGGGTVSPPSYSRFGYFSSLQRYDLQTGSTPSPGVGAPFVGGFAGTSRTGSSLSRKHAGATVTVTHVPGTRSSASAQYAVFCANYSDLPTTAPTSARLAFYSVGAGLDLSSLDSRITKYVNDVAAAIP